MIKDKKIFYTALNYETSLYRRTNYCEIQSIAKYIYIEIYYEWTIKLG